MRGGAVKVSEWDVYGDASARAQGPGGGGVRVVSKEACREVLQERWLPFPSPLPRLPPRLPQKDGWGGWKIGRGCPAGRCRGSLTHRRRPHLADPCLLGYGPDLVDKGEGVSELFPAGLENGALGRREEFGHGQPGSPAGRAGPEQGNRSEQSPTAKASLSSDRSNCTPPQEQGGGGEKRVRGGGPALWEVPPSLFLRGVRSLTPENAFPHCPPHPFVWGARGRQLSSKHEEAHTKRAQGVKRPLQFGIQDTHALKVCFRSKSLSGPCNHDRPGPI